MSADVRLIAYLMVRNERDRYLEKCLRSLVAYCHEVRVIDDASDDGTADLLWRLSRVFPQIKYKRMLTPQYIQNEGHLRQKTLEYAFEGRGTHYLSIDADEFLQNHNLLIALLNSLDETHVYQVRMTEIWKVEGDQLWYRADGHWGPIDVPLVFRAPENYDPEFLSREGWFIEPLPLACGRVPRVIKKLAHAPLPSCRTIPIDILHMGWANPDERQLRYDRYMELDGGKYHNLEHLKSIMYPEGQVELKLYERGRHH